MGVKSTVYLTRKEAEDRYVEYKLKQKVEAKLRAKAVKMSDKDLEDKLEELNDKYYNSEYGNGGGFDNYIIREIDPDDIG